LIGTFRRDVGDGEHLEMVPDDLGHPQSGGISRHQGGPVLPARHRPQKPCYQPLRAVDPPADAQRLSPEPARLAAAAAASRISLEGHTLVCARGDGSPTQPRSLTHQSTDLMGRVKDLPRIRFHDLRHSHATQLLLAGGHPKIAQERLGHSTISVTRDLYSHVISTTQQDAAARIDAAFRGAKMTCAIG
jgi:hypothetical protein